MRAEPRARAYLTAECDSASPCALTILQVDCGRGDLMDWRHIAACREEEPELFFPIGNTGPALAQIDDAKQVCQSCNVQEVCLNWAIETGQDAGVWGGLSEDERRSLKRRRARARAKLA